MTNSRQFVFHVLPNAHLDPVWLWDWREGLNEGISTVKAVLDLMDETPELTFMRGESAIYAHIEKNAPALFRRIREKIEEGRWDVVGGTVIQPDTNLASTEVLCREFERGLGYFEKHLGVRPTVAWLADSFGHTPGLPNVFSAFGIKGFTFTRPQEKQFHLEAPAFWWEGGWGNRVLCYRQHWLWYCSERGNIREVLDATLAGATGQASGNLIHVGVLIGLGNHGGGPTRRHLAELEAWKREHPEVEVRYDTLHRFFADLEREVADRPEALPAIRGELGYCLRGCYSSVQKFKGLYRQGEACIADAETSRSVIGAATGEPVEGLGAAWDALLFNAFHDILPGSSIERAIEDQTVWMGGAIHRAREAKFDALNRLAARVNTSVPPPRRADVPADVPVLLWNSLARPFVGLAEVEVSLDSRPLWAFEGREAELPLVVFDHLQNSVPFQVIPTEHTSMQGVPWRRRVVVPVEIPAWGWTVLRVGWRDEQEAVPVAPGCTGLNNGQTARISNQEWTVEASRGGLRILRGGEDFFAAGKNLEIRLVEDPWGSWGGMKEETDSFVLENLLEAWSLEQFEVCESGPLRATLWTRWRGKNSWVDLTFCVGAGARELQVRGRMLLNERSARLKLVLPCEGAVEVDMPAGTVAREARGQTPMGRWVTRSKEGRTVGFASDGLSDVDAVPGELRITLARATRYADDVKTGPGEKPWLPAVDCGELKFQFCLFAEAVNPDHAAETLTNPPAALTVPAMANPWERRGGLGGIAPDCLRLLSAEQTGPARLNVRVQNRARAAVPAELRFGAECLYLGDLGPQEIRTFVLEKCGEGKWALC